MSGRNCLPLDLRHSSPGDAQEFAHITRGEPDSSEIGRGTSGRGCDLGAKGLGLRAALDQATDLGANAWRQANRVNDLHAGLLETGSFQVHREGTPGMPPRRLQGATERRDIRRTELDHPAAPIVGVLGHVATRVSHGRLLGATTGGPTPVLPGAGCFAASRWGCRANGRAR